MGAPRSVAEGGGKLNLAPVLVDGAQMPTPQALPPDLRALAGRNARPLSHASFRTDLQALAEQLGIELAPETTMAERAVRTVVGAGVALGVFFVASLIHKVVLDQSLETTLGSFTALIALVIGVVLTGAIIPNVTTGSRR